MTIRKRKPQRLFIFAVLLFSWPAFSLPSSSSENQISNLKPLSAEELKIIQGGKTAFRQNEGGIPGGITITFIPLHPQKIWAVIRDYDTYPDYMPDCKKSIVKKFEGNHQFHVYGLYKNVWPFDDIFLETLDVYDDSDPKNLKMTWKTIATNMKWADGFWVTRPYKKGSQEGSIVFYNMRFELDWLPSAMVRSSGKEKVIKVINALKEHTLALQSEKKTN